MLFEFRWICFEGQARSAFCQLTKSRWILLNTHLSHFKFSGQRVKVQHCTFLAAYLIDFKLSAISHLQHFCFYNRFVIIFLISYIVLRDYAWHTIFFIEKLRNEEWLWRRINRPIACISIVSEVVLLAESLRRLYSSSQPPIKSLDVPFDGMSVLLGNVRRGSTGFCNRLVCTDGAAGVEASRRVSSIA